MARLPTPRYVNDDDREAVREQTLDCKGCGQWFVVVRERDRKERMEGREKIGYYICPCGKERIVAVSIPAAEDEVVEEKICF